MATDTNLSQLVINKLTQAQYQEAKDAGSIVETEIYMITDDGDSGIVSHTHSADDITSGVLPVEYGGTGAVTASEALINLGAAAASNVNVKTYTSLAQIGLSGAVTVDTVCAALPESGAILVMQNNLTGLTNYISDTPMASMNLHFYRLGARCIVHAGACGTMNYRSFEGSWHTSSRWSGWRETLTSVLTTAHYGASLPAAGTAGRIFFKKV